MTSDTWPVDSRAFYDKYVDRQLSAGVNARHHLILRWLNRFGLQANDRVLEIGCGVGTLTGLMAAGLGSQGSILGVDLSPRSIDAARGRLAEFDRVQLLAGDILEVEIAGQFDVVVLPDVIEHIPSELHPALFRRIAQWVKASGFVLLHYPNPLFLEWCHTHRPDVLQPVDQPIHADALSANAYAAGLRLDHLETYSIWVAEGDYQVAVLRPRRGNASFTFLEEKLSLADRVKGRIRRALK